MATPRKNPEDFLKNGRPTKFSESILKQSEEYLKNCIDEIEEYHKTRGQKSDSYDRIVRVKLPSVEGLAVYLKVGRQRIYDWKELYPKFRDIFDRLQAMQAERLVNNGLSGDYNPTIAKVLLTKHGYRDAVDSDITSLGEKIESVQFIFPE